MYYYNKSNISRMQIRKKEFVSSLSSALCPEVLIEEVVCPFIPQIKSMRLTLFLARESPIPRQYIRADWESYKLILFNIIQNSVKYNNEKGKIVILLSLSHNFVSKASTLVTEVIDTGLGITRDRQKMLF